MNLDIELVNGGKLPQEFNKSAGFDLYTNEKIILKPYAIAKIATGIKIQPESNDYYMRIVPRSSTSKNYPLYVPEGTIDSDYNGEVFIVVRNLSGKQFEIPRYSRIAQMVPVYRPSVKVRIVSKLRDTARGANGFGSTGTN